MYLLHIIILAKFLLITGCTTTKKFDTIDGDFRIQTPHQGEGVDYFFCQEIHPFSKNLYPFISTNQIGWIRNSLSCQTSIKGIPSNNQIELQVFQIVPTNFSGFLQTFAQIKSVLSHQKRQFREPIFILNWPELVNSTNDAETSLRSLFLQGESNHCVPLTSLVFITISWKTLSETNSTIIVKIETGVWEIYCIELIPVIARVQGVFSKREGNKNLELDLLSLTRISPRRNDMRGFRLKVLAKVSYGNQGETKALKTNESLELLSGLTVFILWDFRDTLNFTITAIQGGESMRPTKNGSVTGIGRQMIDGVGDFSIALSNLLPYRQQNVDFLQPTTADRSCTYFIQPPSSRNIHLLPFSGTLWLGLFFTWLAMFCSSLILRKYTLKDEQHYTFGELVLWAIATISAQGWYAHPKTSPWKMLFLVGFLMGVVSLAAYSASIVALLSQKHKPIKDYDDLFDYGFTLIGNTSTNYNHALTPKKIEELEKRAAAVLLSVNDSIVELFNPNSRVATTMNYNEFYYYARNLDYAEVDLCRVEKFKASATSTRTGMFIRKGMALKKFLNVKATVLVERGLSHRYLAQYFAEILPGCNKNWSKSLDAFRIEDARMAIGIFLFGGIVSLLALFIELLYNLFMFRTILN